MTAGSIGFDTTEIRALARKFEGAERIVNEELKDAFDESGGIVLSGARANIHHKTGALGAGGRKRTRVGGRMVITIVDFDRVKYAKWVEWGRGPVIAKRAKYLHFFIGGQEFFRKSVGPAKAQRFLGRAFDSSLPAIVRRMDVAAANVARRLLS